MVLKSLYTFIALIEFFAVIKSIGTNKFWNQCTLMETDIYIDLDLDMDTIIYMDINISEMDTDMDTGITMDTFI